MSGVVLIDTAADVATLGLLVACAYALLNAYARHHRPQWTAPLTRRRLAVLAVLTLAVSSIKVFEDVLAKESGPLDEAILWFIRAHVPASLGPTFNAITISGSARVLIPLAVLLALPLVWARRWFEALLLACSLLIANGVVFSLKTIVGRERPDLWEAKWYWGSSFPSGHTLSTAALSTAAALCVARIWPRRAGDGAGHVVDRRGGYLAPGARGALANRRAGCHLLGRLHSAADQRIV